MFLDRLSPREKLLLYATITIVAVAVSYNFILEPLTIKWGHLNSEIVQRTAKLQRNLNMLKREELIKREFAGYSAFTESVGSDEETIAYLLRSIEQKASQTSTYITNIRPRPPKETDLYKEFTFEVISESSLEELLRFMYELQNSKELLTVKRLTLTLKSGPTQRLRGVMDIIKIYAKSPE